MTTTTTTKYLTPITWKFRQKLSFLEQWINDGKKKYGKKILLKKTKDNRNIKYSIYQLKRKCHKSFRFLKTHFRILKKKLNSVTVMDINIEHNISGIIQRVFIVRTKRWKAFS